MRKHAPITVRPPELWTPEHMRERYDDTRAQIDAERREYDPDWQTNLDGRADRHIRSAIAALDYNGVTPGALRPPDAMIGKHYRDEPIKKYDDGTTSRAMTMQPAQPTEQDRADYAAYQADQEQVPGFTERVRAVKDEVKRDGRRAWDLYTHLNVLDGIELQLKREAAEREQQALFRAMHECPICGEADPPRIGLIRLRSFLPTGTASTDRPELSIRSCEACWSVASTVHLEQLASSRLASGHSRRDLVTRLAAFTPATIGN